MIGSPKKGMIWQMSKTKQRKSKAGKSIAIFFIVFIILEGLIIFGLKTIFKTEDSTPSFGGYSFFLMDSDNMSPTVPKNTLVIAVNGKPSEDKISCAVLCKNVGDEGTTVAWLTEIGSKGDTVNGIVYTVYQDNVSGADNGARFYDIDSDNVVGVAASHYVTAGKIISFVITPFGIAICLAVPLVMLVLLELVVAITNRSDDESYEPDDYARAQQQFYNNGGKGGPQRGQNGNVSLDDFLYGGNGDEVYNGGKPDADYAEEFGGRQPGRPQQQRPMQQNMQNPMRGKPDFSLNNEPDDDFDPFGEEEDNGFADNAPEGFGGFRQQEDDSAFYHPGDEAVAETFEDEEDDSVFFDAPSPAPAPVPTPAPAPAPAPAPVQQPSVDREYYERASKLIEGDDYQPAPQPMQQQPRPVMQQQAQAPVQQPTVALEKPKAQAPAPAAAPARRPVQAQQPSAPTPRRRPSQPPQGAPRRRPAGAPPTRQGSGQRRPRPAQPRPGQQPRRAPHKDANAALADLVKKMNEEQQKLGSKSE